MAYCVSTGLSRQIYDDALVGYTEPTHPCHPFVYLQPGVPMDQLQLPVPFMGARAEKRIVFLGFNPSFGGRERGSPRVGATFEEFDQYWRSVFDAKTDESQSRLYGLYQRIGEESTGPTFRLGHDAVVLELIHFRSPTQSPLCYDPQVLRHELPITRAGLEQVQPKVVVVVGADTLSYAQDVLPGLREKLPGRVKVTDPAVEASIVKLEDPALGQLAIVPVRHLTGAFGVSSELLSLVGAAVSRALHE